jgi:CRISPR-associated protein Csm3
MELKYKIQITGKLTLETGLHIGGSEVELEIGGIDKAVIKDKKDGRPYIPGSSLKGKLRDLIARKMGYQSHEKDVKDTFILFGDGANPKEKHRNNGHLIVRDAFYAGKEFNPEKGLEEKSENTIDRTNGGAKPRSLERVVRGASFDLDMILDIYDKYDVKYEVQGEGKNKTTKYNTQTIEDQQLLNTLKMGFRLLESDYLGGSGTRGYGKVSLEFNTPRKINFNEDGTVSIEDMTFDFNTGANESH